MFRSLTLLAAIAFAGCASFASLDAPRVAPCEYVEPLAPFCVEAGELSCYGADVAKHDNGSAVCVWRCVELEKGFFQDIYAVFNPEPALHLDTMIATGPAARCE